jgi:hypothetical protein
MKKFYAFLAAALMSVSVFASADQVPSDAVLADYYDAGQVCVCIFVPADMACNDIVLVGSFFADAEKKWYTSPVSELKHFEPVEGYDGWYVTAYDPEDEPDAEKGLQAKPVMLDVDGNFNWEYQVGAATVIRGGVQVVDGFSGEIDLINYGTDAPNVFSVDAWKQNPCTAIYHNYRVEVISKGCGGYVVPFIVGAMNEWSFQQMQLDEDKTRELEVPTYYISFKAAENTPYQIVSGLMNEQGVIEGDNAPGWKDEAYLEVLNENGVWSRYEPSNSFLGTEANLVYDLREDTIRWARCDETPAEYTCVAIKLPELNRPEAIEIIGGFDGWAGTAMELLNTGYYFAEIEAKPSQFFKIRGAGSWDQELELYNSEDDAWAKIQDGQFVFGQIWDPEGTWHGVKCNWVEFDWSDPEVCRWTVPGEEGIENIVLTEKAKKVVVDGAVYIIRDNKMFNIHGAQVR